MTSRLAAVLLFGVLLMASATAQAFIKNQTVAPDGKTFPIMNLYVRMIGEENKWVMWTVGPDGGPIWRYAKLVKVTVPEHIEERFEVIDADQQ